MPGKQFHSIAKFDRWPIVTVKAPLGVAVCVEWPVAQDGSIRERPPRSSMLHGAAQSIVGHARPVAANAQEAVVPKKLFKSIVIVDAGHVPDPAVPGDAGAGRALHDLRNFDTGTNARAPDCHGRLLDDVVFAWGVV